MARKFLTPINLSTLELQDATIQNKSAATINGITPVAGQVYYDSTNNVLRVAVGTATTSWRTIAMNQTTGSYTSSIILGGTTINIGDASVSSLSNISISGSGTWTATAIASNYGGTGVSSYAVGDTLYASSATAGTALSKLTIGAGNSVMVVNAGGTAPAWVATLPVVSGGTGGATGSITGTGALTFTAGGTNTNVNLVPNGTGTVDVGSKRITSVAYPTGATDAANKQYVDDVVAGIEWKSSVKFKNSAATSLGAMFAAAGAITETYTPTSGSNAAYITLSVGGNWTQVTWGAAGPTLTAGDRILLTDQGSITGATTAGSSSGIYTVGTVPTVSTTTSWVFTRASDADGLVNSSTGTTGELAAGAAVFIDTTTGPYAGTAWILTTTGTITLGTTAQAWTQFTGAQSLTWGNGLQSTNNTASIKLDSAPNGLAVSGTGLKVDPTTIWIGTSNVALSTGAPGSSQALTGILSIAGLTTLTGAASNTFTITSGTSATTGTTLQLTAGTGTTSSAGGVVQIVGGTGGSSAGNGGAVTITGGAYGTGGTLGGNVTIDAGSSTAGSPSVIIGNTNATQITIGRNSGGQTTSLLSPTIKLTNISAATTTAATAGNGVLRVDSNNNVVTDSSVTRKWFYGNPSLTVTSTSISWVITYDSSLANLSNIKHNFGATGAISAQLMDYTSGQVYDADITIAPASGQVTVSATNPAWTTTPLTANTLSLLLMG